MSDPVWLAMIAAIPGTIAAISSLLNGREQKRVREELKETNGKISAVVGRTKKRPKKPEQPGGADGNTASNPDWYNPPDLN